LITKSNTERGIKFPETLSSLREKLGQKAKREPRFRFYSLYGHLLRKDVLRTAWRISKRNQGAAGIDGITFKDIEESPEGIQGFLDSIQKTLKEKTYRADPVKRVYIPKGNGRQRPLGLITIKDRIVQTALLLILEPIYETEFQDCSYGFRPHKSAHEAIDVLQKEIHHGKTQAYDADLEDCFGSIPHDKLLKTLQLRIADKQILKLIQMWLKASIREKGKPQYKPTRGLQQGGVTSPLLTNTYLNWFDKAFLGPSNPGKGAKLLRFADDIAVVAREITPQLVEFIKHILEDRLGLKLNREKTKTISLKRGESMSFLGYTFRYVPLLQNPQKRYCNYKVSKKGQIKARQAIKTLARTVGRRVRIEDFLPRLNLYLDGWGRYFSKGYPSREFDKLNHYVRHTVRKELMRKSQRGYKIGKDKTWYQYFKEQGLVHLSKQRYA
jgi:RNA-directed DNA polymerase